MKKVDLVSEYGKELYKIGLKEENLFVVDCDLSKSSGTNNFMEAFPDRYVNCGIAEQNAFGISAGLSAVGYIPVVHTFAVFASMRALDQIRNSICYPNQNVKIIGHKAGLSDSFNGATHQSIEDLGIMSTLPNMTVLTPSDDYETKAAINEAVNIQGPVYIRISKLKVPQINLKFEIGKANVIKNGNDITIISCGDRLHDCIQASEILEKNNISVNLVNISTIKPIDKDQIIAAAKKTRALITVESHNIYNGLGSQINKIIANNYPIKVENIGIEDCFTETGEYEYLINEYNIGVTEIVSRSKKLMEERMLSLEF